MKSIIKIVYWLFFLSLSAAAWGQQDKIIVHDTTMDMVVVLLWAILVIQLVVSIIMLFHTIQMNRWLRVRHFLFDKQIEQYAPTKKKTAKKVNEQTSARQEDIKGSTSVESNHTKKTQHSPKGTNKNAPSTSEESMPEPEPDPGPTGYAQINEKMADFENSAKKSRKQHNQTRSEQHEMTYSEPQTYQPPSDNNTMSMDQQEAAPSDDADASRLDLAKAYIEMGEYARAKKLLNKVLDNTNNPANQAEAQYWLEIVAEKADE